MACSHVYVGKENSGASHKQSSQQEIFYLWEIAPLSQFAINKHTEAKAVNVLKNSFTYYCFFYLFASAEVSRASTT